MRPKLLDDIRVPGVANQESPLPAIRSHARLAYTELEMTCAVSGAGVSKVREVSQEAHLQVNNFDPGLACSGKHSVHKALGDTFERNGQYQEAVEQWTKAMLLANDTELASTLGGPKTKEAVDTAVRAVAVKRLDRLLQNREGGDYIPAIRFAREHLRAGHQEEALNWLTLACEERNVYALMIASDPFYDPLRGDRRFAKLLRRMKLDS